MSLCRQIISVYNSERIITSSSAVAKRPRDASCLSVVSFNSTKCRTESSIVSYTMLQIYHCVQLNALFCCLWRNVETSCHDISSSLLLSTPPLTTGDKCHKLRSDLVAAVRHLEFYKFIFGHVTVVEMCCYVPNVIKIEWFWLKYGDLTICNMAAVRHVELSKFRLYVMYNTLSQCYSDSMYKTSLKSDNRLLSYGQKNDLKMAVVHHLEF